MVKLERGAGYHLCFSWWKKLPDVGGSGLTCNSWWFYQFIFKGFLTVNPIAPPFLISYVAFICHKNI